MAVQLARSLCSRNARSRTPLVGRAQWETDSGRREAYFSRWGRRGNERVWKEYVLMEAQQHPSGVNAANSGFVMLTPTARAS